MWKICTTDIFKRKLLFNKKLNLTIDNSYEVGKSWKYKKKYAVIDDENNIIHIDKNMFRNLTEIEDMILSLINLKEDIEYLDVSISDLNEETEAVISKRDKCKNEFIKINKEYTNKYLIK